MREYISRAEEETFALAKELAQHAKPGEAYCLHGDLGAGKTVFAKGFAAGLGIEEPITSPTFNIVKEYEDGRLPFYHFDVYRIADPEEMYAIGYDSYVDGDGVCLIEWPEMLEDLVPEHAVHIEIARAADENDSFRRIRIYEEGEAMP